MSKLLAIHPFEVEVGEKACTVRRGPKWFYDTDQIIELVYQHDGIEETFGHGRIITRAFLSFAALTDEMLENEHEASSRTKAGLLESMYRAYGEDFNEAEPITLLTYMRID